MSYPEGVAKSDSGFLFILRTRDELQGWTTPALDDRLRHVKAAMSDDSAGLAWARSRVRNIAVAERRALIDEIVRRIHTH